MSEKTRGNWMLGFCVRSLVGWKDRRTGKRGTRCRNWNDQERCDACIRFGNYVPEDVGEVKQKRKRR